MKVSMKQFVMYLEGLQTYSKKERELVEEIGKMIEEEDDGEDATAAAAAAAAAHDKNQDPNALMARVKRMNKYSLSRKKLEKELIDPLDNEAFCFPTWDVEILHEGRNYNADGDNVFLSGPFGDNNIYVPMEQDLIDGSLKNLYGYVHPRWERLQYVICYRMEGITKSDSVFDLLHDEEKLHDWYKEKNQEDLFVKSIDKINQPTDMKFGGCNKSYDVLDFDSSEYTSDCPVVVFNGLESLLGFLVYLDTNDRKWNDLERSMAYRAACGRGGVPKGKEKDFLPDGSDILMTIQAMEKIKDLFSIPQYDPTNTTLSDFVTNGPIGMTLDVYNKTSASNERFSFPMPFGFLS